MKLTTISKFLAKKSVRAGLIFTLVGGISGTVTYFAFPSFPKNETGGGNIDNTDDPDDIIAETSVDKFSAKLTETTGIEGTLDFSVSFPDKDDSSTTMNTISIKDAGLKVAMPSTGSLGFDFNGSINYNDWGDENVEKATTHINLVDKNAYIDFWGGKVAYLDTEYKSLVGELIGIFSDSVIQIPDEFYDLFDKIAGNSSDSSEEEGSSSSSSLADTTMSWSCVNDGESQKQFKLDIGLSGTTITLNLWSDGDYNLTRVLADNLTFGDFTLNLDFRTQINENELEVIRGLVPSDYQNYTSLYGLKGIIRKVGNAIAKERFNVNADLTINHTNGDVNENVGIDLDTTLDFGDKNFTAGLELSNEADKTYSQKLDLAYLKEDSDTNAYVNYNDTMKASMNLLTLEALISRMNNDGNQQDMSALSKVFDFVFDSEIVKDIQKGHYEKIANEVEKLDISSDKIVVKIKLDKIGFGDSSLVTITLDGTKDKPISEVALSNIKAKNFSLNGTINVASYVAPSFDTTGYYSMEHLPDVFDQVSDLVDSKQATVKLEGSVLDANNLGLSLDGNASFDANLKEGTGSIKLSQITSNYTKNHLFSLDLDEKQALFNYNDFDKKDEYAGLNGSISISSVGDLIDFIKSLTGDDSIKQRFSGIFSSLQENATSGIISDVMAGKYASLLSAKILKTCTINSDKIDLTINGEIFGLESDINIIINFADTTKVVTNENGEATDEIIRNIKSVELKNFAISGKTINVKLSLEKFDNKLSSLDKTLTYTDFSSVSTMIQYFANTATSLDTYHLKSSVSVVLWTADIITIDADLYISIQEDGTKIYGSLSNIPLIPAVNNNTWLFGDHGDDASFYRTVNFYYDGSNIYAHGVNPFGVFEAEDEDGNKTSYDLTQIQDYKYETSYFKKTDNIINFLLKDVINLQDRLLKKVSTNDISLPENKSALATERLFDSFSYDQDSSKWDLSLDLGALLNNDFLKNLDLTVKGTSDKYIEGLNLALTIFAGVKIQVLADVSLTNIGKNEFPLESFNSYISAHSSDELSAK